ncbi:hypothetical protein SUGI_0909200 [Cryptomeria japonica]|uniref:disease resistance protein RPV1 n=1 Tax=Cryptomeria japonica TaxID=3369 RepID=UPI0024149477|nr:disease resistance protein RPV1 [Cryptomeria japonica]GLJ43674.1 hypothetical protein SUGI_0909200 [Cryptomeria japonica]
MASTSAVGMTDSFDGMAPPSSLQSNSVASTSAVGMTDSFDGMAQPSSASGIASSVMPKSSYHVFINHHSPDVKQTIASTLSDIITGMRMTVVLGSEDLEYGNCLPQAIEAVISDALLHIAIFSKGYAESPWCLAELSIMLKTGIPVIPIFYHIEPTDLRYVAQGKGKFVKAFEEHAKKGRYSLKQLEGWKNALYNVSFYTGQLIKSNDDEKRLLKNIVNILLKVIDNVPLEVAKYPVGLNEIIKDFEMNTFQSDQGHDIVEIVGIWGMGGSGKTTLAKELYNKRSLLMERSSFLSSFISDVRDAATKGMLHNKQIKLLEDLGVKVVEFDNVEDGKAFLARRLRSVKVFIVLDDVDHVDQLDALVPIKDSLCKGSLIIVTTREKRALKSWGISSIYKMKPLDPFHAEELFCWHAFLKSVPVKGFEDIVKKFLRACNGLPLSLKVFGAQLYGNSHQYWEVQLNKISKILPTDIKERLKVSYDALDCEEKEAFLDIACFFIGEKSSLAIEVWYGSGWTGLHSWEMLLNKCLVDLDIENCIDMHDHLRDLGREISSRKSPYRMWLPGQIISVDKKAEIKNSVRGIIGAKRWPWDEGSSNEVDQILPSLDELKILAIKGSYFNRVISEVSRELVWLRWFRFEQRNLRSLISIKKLRVLELHSPSSIEELWEAGGDVPVELRELVVSGCRKFQRFPNSIGCLKHLKKMVITRPRDVTRLPEEFCNLQSLEHMELSSCAMLSSLPSSFGDLRNLRHLDFSSCEMLSSLPNSFGGLANLRHLDLSSCVMLSSLPSSFGDLRNLQHLDLSGCIELRMLPESFKHLILLQCLKLEGCEKITLNSEDFADIRKLEILNLDRCKQLEELPRHITNQALLRELHLKDTSLMELPTELGQLSKLREMVIKSEFLNILPSSIGNLSSLTSFEMYDCPVESLPSSVGDLLSLTHLTIDGSLELQFIPDSVGRLSLLEDLTMNYLGVKSLPKSITQLNNLRTLKIYECPISDLDFGVASLHFALSNLKQIELTATGVRRISISEDCCPSLETLELWFNYHLTEIEVLPTKVKTIKLIGCKKLKNLPSFAQLTSLIEFELSDRTQVEKIEGLEHCRLLESLRVDTCGDEPGLEGLEHMQKLRRLQLRANKGSAIEPCIQKLKKWPDEIQICSRAVPDAASLLEFLLSAKLFVVDSSSHLKINSRASLLQKHCSNGEAFMLCFVVNCVSSQLTMYITSYSVSGYSYNYAMEMYKGKWIWIGVFKGGNEFREEGFEIDQRGQSEDENEVETCLLLTGEEHMLLEAFCSLLPILQK